MSMDKKVPKIRFKGFSEKWKKKELGKDVADIIGGGTPSTLISEFWDGDIDWYSPTEIGSRVYAEGSHKKITLLGLKSSSAKILPAGKTVLFTSRAGIGDMAILTKPGATNQGFQSFIVKEGFSPYFIYSVGKQIKEFALKHASGSTFLEISGKQLGRMKILMPILEEQTTIGNYFQKLDTLINQHQKKHDKLCNIKQAMLEKMFPKQGETIPEIRFKGFSGEWENKGIEEISKVFIGLVTTMTTSYRNQGVLLIRNSDIKNNRFEFSDSPIYLDKKFADENSSRKLMLGDVITVHTGDVGTSAVVTEKEEGSIGFATIVSRPNKNIVDSNYLSVFFNTDIHKNFAMNVSTGDGRANYNLKDFYKLKVPLPAIDEQIKIGLLVQKLDALINQHHQQITKLKNIKQACLSKMFV